MSGRWYCNTGIPRQTRSTTGPVTVNKVIFFINTVHHDGHVILPDRIAPGVIDLDTIGIGRDLSADRRHLLDALLGEKCSGADGYPQRNDRYQDNSSQCIRETEVQRFFPQWSTPPTPWIVAAYVAFVAVSRIP